MSAYAKAILFYGYYWDEETELVDGDLDEIVAKPSGEPSLFLASCFWQN